MFVYCSYGDDNNGWSVFGNLDDSADVDVGVNEGDNEEDDADEDKCSDDAVSVK